MKLLKLFWRMLVALTFVFVSDDVAIAQTKHTIIVETVPSGAMVEIVYYRYGEMLENKECVSPCRYVTNLDRGYHVKVAKPGYANYQLDSKNPFNINGIEKSKAEIEILTSVHKESGYLKVDKTGKETRYKIILETHEVKSLRRAKQRLARECPTIFKKHFVSGDRPARPCLTSKTSPFTYLSKGSCHFTFDVDFIGRIKNIRDEKCTPSLDASRLKQIEESRNWRYFPAIQNGKPVRSDGVKLFIDLDKEDAEFACTDILAKYEDVSTHDAVPCKRHKPKTPKKLKGTQSCDVVFDVTAEGHTKNIETENCTDKKIKKPSKQAAKRWLYIPKKISGVPTERKAVKARIHFPR